MGPEAHDLPRERPGATSARRVALLVLGALLLLGAANEAARRVLRVATPNIGYALVPQKWRLLLERERPVDWLVLGDSSCNQGLDPAVLAAALGGEALNLCTVASSLALDAAWMLDWHVERLGPPGAVAAIHSYHVWHRGLPPFAVAHVPLAWGFWRDLEPRLQPGAAWTFQGWVARYVPLYAENKSLMRLLMRPWEAQRHYRVDAHGFMSVAQGSARGVEKDVRKRLAWLEQQHGLRLSAENRDALERMGALADRHGFDVFLVNAPIYRELAESSAFRRYQAEVSSALAEVASHHARLHYVPRTFTFGPGEMQNGDHLLAAAAERYTESVADAIADTRGTHLADR